MTDNLPQHIPFLSFKTKPNVSKSKLSGTLAKKGWNDFTDGFSEETTLKKGDDPIKKKAKIDPVEFRKQILSEGCKTKLRSPVIEHKEAGFFSSKANDFCNLIQKKSLKFGNQKDLNSPHFNRCPSSVFLEVQNIQNSFKENKSTLINKRSAKFCSKYPYRNFISNLASKNEGGQENVPSKNGCLFNFKEIDFSPSASIKKVQKTNIFSSLAKKNASLTNSLSDLKTNSSYLEKNHGKSKSSDFEKYTCKELLPDQHQNKCASLNLSALLEVETLRNKGSSWLQSLQITDTEVASEDAIGKKRIRSILPGGFAEQMLKLQRIEKSEEVFWDHNVDKNRKKGKHLPLLLISTTSTRGIVIAKCQTFPSNNGLERPVIEHDEVPTESEQIFVLLKKSVFNKLHLKVRSIFHLYPPWQTIHLPQISCPVILCAKFIDLESFEGEVTQDTILNGHSMSTSSSSASHQASNCFNEIFYQWQQPISLSGRIQRIWKIKTTEKDLFSFASTHYFRYSLLLQEQNGIFYEIVQSPTHSLPNFSEEFISEAEGKCYEFHGLHVISRFCLNKHPQFFKVLNLLSMANDDGNSFKQEFCYQLAFRSCLTIPEAVKDDGFPAYCPISLQPLTSLFKEENIHRFSCIGKIVFQFRKTLYLCDDSVPKYVQLEFSFPFHSERPLVGSLVLIRDAQWLQGCLFLDEYSSFTQICEESQIEERLKQLILNRLDQLRNITLQSVIPTINVASEISMFVFIKGEVIGVDTNNALSWLQCNLCLSDNLLQDSQLVIYCENCFQVVPKPVLNVKMSVTCQCSPHVKVEVKLLSRTVKRILQIDENIQQPRCNVEDILGKHIGPILCFIRSVSAVGDGKQFCATEVDER